MHQHLQQTASKLAEAKIIPVFYHADEATCLHVVEACYAGGMRVFEFTNRGDQALANFKAIRKRILESCPDMLLGAGTIYNNRTAKLFIDAGADFIVSPAFMPAMQSLQNNSYTLWIPGCGTISELAQARELGALIIKVFPGDLLGPKFVAAALSVMPDLQLMPTGGVEPTRENLAGWYNAGVMCVGMGSQLITKEILEKGDWQKLQQRVKDALAIVGELKK